jgi:hypothetical protein
LKVLVITTMLALMPSLVWASCASRLVVAQSGIDGYSTEVSRVLSDATDSCPGGFTAACWVIEDSGDTLATTRIADLDGWAAEITTDCASETDTDILNWRTAVDGELAATRAQFQFLRDTHASLNP